MNNYQQELEKEIKALENAYSRGGKYLVDGKPRYSAHAVRLEESLGISGIAPS